MPEHPDQRAGASDGNRPFGASDLPQAGALDGALADLLDLGLLADHARWNLVGKAFLPIQQLLGSLGELARTSADGIAERAVTLGHAPDGRATTITTSSSLPAVEPGPQHDTATIDTFLTLLDAVTTRIHVVLEAFETDLVTVELFTGMLAEIERYAWKFRAQRDR